MNDTHDDEPAPVSDALDRVLRGLGMPSAATVSTVFGCWADVAGTPLADHTTPISLTDGRLVVRVDGPAWATQLRFREVDLLAQFADRLGPGEVTRIDLRVGEI